MNKFFTFLYFPITYSKAHSQTFQSCKAHNEILNILPNLQPCGSPVYCNNIDTTDIYMIKFKSNKDGGKYSGHTIILAC